MKQLLTLNLTEGKKFDHIYLRVAIGADKELNYLVDEDFL